MSFNCKNYTEQGGEKTVIGGTLEIAEGGKVLGLESTFTQAENQDESTASTIAELKSDFNALLLKLKEAGLMKQNSI